MSVLLLLSFLLTFVFDTLPSLSFLLASHNFELRLHTIQCSTLLNTGNICVNVDENTSGINGMTVLDKPSRLFKKCNAS